VAAPSNDDLLYDPEMDDDDERWVNRQRMSYQPALARQTASGARRRLPHSDAVLNCPACMSLLCLDCQRLNSNYEERIQMKNRLKNLAVILSCYKCRFYKKSERTVCFHKSSLAPHSF